MRYQLVVLLLLVAVGGFPQSAHTSTLESAMLDRIANSVFEVVVQKPEKDSLSYAYPLPLDRLPYSVRTDNYYPIGSAFAMSPTEFVSASHVMNLASASQFKEVYLRGKDGAVYHIDKILKYSERRDFVVFSLKDKKAEQYLEMYIKARINESVLAVGNALGEGIIMRDGLYTSDTPEDEEGEWKWMRFSAAASPGNSGGPLLDNAGRVIGVIIGKSPNENLNYALPIAEVLNAGAQTALAYRNLTYLLMNLSTNETKKYIRELPLPMSYGQLATALADWMSLNSYDMAKGLFTRQRDSVFPNGPGSDAVLHSTFDTVFPHLLRQIADGQWDLSRPREIVEVQLGNGGHLSYGNADGTVMLFVQTGDKFSLQDFFDDGTLFMDTILRGFPLMRQVGSAQVRITSLGKPSDSSAFADSYGRKWQVRGYALEYCDEKVLTFSLPIPGGCVILLRKDQTGVVDRGHADDLKILTNFLYLTYHGTLKQWREFLGMGELLPAAFSSIELSYDTDNFFRFQSKRVLLSFSAEAMPISDSSYVKLFFNYFRDGGRTVWDVARVLVGADVNRETRFRIVRHHKPPAELPAVYQGKWDAVVGRKFPFNRSTYYEGKATSIETLIGKEEADVGSVLYTAGFIKEGKAEPTEMESALGEFLKGVEIREGTPGADTAPAARTDAYHERGEYYRALWEPRPGEKLVPQSADGYLLRGTIWDDMGEHARAVEDFSNAIELEPRYLEPYLLRGQTYRKRKDNERALADFDRAVELKPLDAEANFYRGSVYEELGQCDQAISDHSKAVELNPQLVESYVGRGICYTKAKNWERALADFDKAVQIRPKFALAYHNRGVAYRDRGDQKLVRSGSASSREGDALLALSDLSRAIELDPRLPEAYTVRGVLYGKSGQCDLAIDDFNKALELEPTNAELYNDRGFTFKTRGDFDHAIEDFDRSIALNPRDALTYINRGNTYAQKKDMDKACQDWKQACIIADCGNYLRGQNAGFCR